MASNNHFRTTVSRSTSNREYSTLKDDSLTSSVKPNKSIQESIDNNKKQSYKDDTSMNQHMLRELSCSEIDIVQSNCPVIGAQYGEQPSVGSLSIAEPFGSAYSSGTPLFQSLDAIIHAIDGDPYHFVCHALPKVVNSLTKCCLIADKTGGSVKHHLKIELEPNKELIPLLIAESKSKVLSHSSYLITYNPELCTNSFCAELICKNTTATEYTLHVLGGKQFNSLATIHYAQNFLGFKGPRKIEVQLPKHNDQMQSLFNESEINEYCSQEQNNLYVNLHNKTPIWNENAKMFIIDFQGEHRITIPSIKNFQMVIKNNKDIEEVIMQFGRMSEAEEIFSCDFRYPLSFIQVFAIGLSSLKTHVFRE